MSSWRTYLWRYMRERIRRSDHTLTYWHIRAKSRRELAELDERLLKDMGIDHLQAKKEARKPFWRN